MRYSVLFLGTLARDGNLSDIMSDGILLAFAGQYFPLDGDSIIAVGMVYCVNSRYLH